MKTTSLLPLLATALLFLPTMLGEANAEGSDQTGTGNELLRNCKGGLQYIDEREVNSIGGKLAFRECSSVVRATMETYLYLTVDRDLRGLPICGPSRVTVGQEMRIVAKYLEDNPQELHRADVTLVLDAMQNAFPCES